MTGQHLRNPLREQISKLRQLELASAIKVSSPTNIH